MAPVRPKCPYDGDFCYYYSYNVGTCMNCDRGMGAIIDPPYNPDPID